jgi:hypothetical protein
MRALAALFALVAVLGCKAPAPAPARWSMAAPGVSKPEDLFTVRLLEVDPDGHPKDPAQLKAVEGAADKAEDAFLFIHGWRRDASSLGAMEAFLQIYREAFDCLAGRDVEGTPGCAATHSYCHAEKAASKLVVLVLWDARSSLFGFRATQRRAQDIGRDGLLDLMRDIHSRIGSRGTFFAVGHSLGGAALMAGLQKASTEGPLPVDGAMLLMGAFDQAPLNLRPGSGGGAVILNLFNRRDGYLRMYRWVWGHASAGERGLAAVPISDGAVWESQGGACGQNEATYGASLLDLGLCYALPKGQRLQALNLDVTGLVKGHVDIERLPAIRLYHRAMAEMIFRVLWDRLEAPAPSAAALDKPVP